MNISQEFSQFPLLGTFMLASERTKADSVDLCVLSCLRSALRSSNQLQGGRGGWKILHTSESHNIMLPMENVLCYISPYPTMLAVRKQKPVPL